MTIDQALDRMTVNLQTVAIVVRRIHDITATDEYAAEADQREVLAKQIRAFAGEFEEIAERLRADALKIETKQT